jgi:hypothetical protein
MVFKTLTNLFLFGAFFSWVNLSLADPITDGLLDPDTQPKFVVPVP